MASATTTPPQAVDGRGMRQAQRYQDGLGHAPSKGNQTWVAIRKELADTYLLYAAQLGLNHQGFPWDEDDVDVSGNTSKTLWMYLIICGWEKLAKIKLNKNPQKGFYGIESLTVDEADLGKFNRGMFPIVANPLLLPSQRQMIGDKNKPLGSLNLTRQVLRLAWNAAGLVLQSVDPDTKSVRLIFDPKTYEAAKLNHHERRARRRAGTEEEREEDEAAAAAEKRRKRRRASDIADAALPPHTKKKRRCHRSASASPSTVLREELAAERDRLKERLGRIAQARRLHEETRQSLRADHAATCVWLQTLGARYTLEESRLFTLDSLHLLHANTNQLEDPARILTRLRQIKAMRDGVERSLHDLREAYGQTEARIRLVAAKLRCVKDHLHELETEQESIDRLCQSIEMRCMLIELDGAQ